jgi:ankyrin repeat protein
MAIPILIDRNTAGECPLHIAARKGREESVASILRGLKGLNLWHERQAKDNNGYTALHAAAKNNMVVVVERLCSLGKMDPDVPDNSQCTALHLAAANGYDAVISHLLDYHWRPTAKNAEKQTPLHLAAVGGHERAVDVLLNRGDEAKNLKDRFQEPPLYYAAMGKYKRVAERFKTAKADLEAPKTGQTLLHQMASGGFAEAAEIMIGLGANKEARDNSGRTPLYAAAQANHKEAFLVLYKNHANVNAVERGTNKTLLHRAVDDGSNSATSLLLEAKAKTEEKNNEGQTALYYAAKSNQPTIARMIVSKADKESPDSNRQTLLHRAAREGDSVAAGILCDIRAQKEAVDDKERTPLYLAAELGHESVVKVLAAKGALVDARDANGGTLLHRAAREGNQTATDLLIQVDAPRNAQDDEGRSPLHVAATHAIQVVIALLDAEAKKDLRDNNGQTPLHVAASRGDQAAKMMETLVDYGAKVVTQDNNGQTPLHAAAIRGELDILVELFKYDEVKEYKDLQDKNGRTALHVAAEHDRVDAVHLLINEELDLEVEDNDGRTPLHKAAEHGRVEVVQKLLAGGANRAAKDKLGQYPLHLASGSARRSRETMDLLTDTREFTFVSCISSPFFSLILTRGYLKPYENTSSSFANSSRITSTAFLTLTIHALRT